MFTDVCEITRWPQACTGYVGDPGFESRPNYNFSPAAVKSSPIDSQLFTVNLAQLHKKISKNGTSTMYQNTTRAEYSKAFS